MSSIKKKVVALLAVFGCLTASAANAAEICEYGFVVGADYLYWSPCVSNLHYVSSNVEVTNSDPNTQTFDYHFIHPDWDQGFRVFLGKEDLFGCFDVWATYTNFSAKNSDEILPGGGTLYTLSWPTPLGTPTPLPHAISDWKIDFQRAQLVGGYSVEFGRGCGLHFKPFAGVDYAQIKQDRLDQLIEVQSDEEEGSGDPIRTNSIARSLDYSGVGPMAGIGYTFEFTDGLSTFGLASLSLLVGEAKIQDVQEIVDRETPSRHDVNTQNYKDDCVCVPSAHLQLGLEFRTCVGGKWLLLRAGYEYLQYLHAPSYLMYDLDHPGSFTALNHNSVTFQGFFGGASVAF